MAAIDYTGYESGGVAGHRRRGSPVAGSVQQPTATAAGPETAPNPDSTPPAGPTPAPSFNYGNTFGYSAEKFGDPNKHDFKYDTARTLSQFDPRKGFSPEVLAALNALGYGTFSSPGGDKLSLSGAKNAKDAADFANQDWIYAFDAQNPDTKWMFGGGGAAPQPTMQEAAYGPDFAQMFAPTLYPSYQQQPQQQQMPAIFSDPGFWQQLVAAMQPQYQPGYSNAPTPSFGGAQYGTSHAPVQQQNPQITQLLSQLFAGLSGG